MENIILAVDAMGSDDKVNVEVNAAMKFVGEITDAVVNLYGDSKLINEYLVPHDRINVVHCNDVIDINEEPVIQIRNKKDASMVRAMNDVKTGVANCFVSAGSTGGIIAGGLLVIGRIKGIKRPALAPIMPTLSSELKVMLDVGANDEVKEVYLLQNAKMGIEYLKIFGVNNPKVALLNIGSEAKKGTPIYQETYKMLLEDENVNFVGNIEGRDILSTDANVIVTDGFSGNIAMKTFEGTAVAMNSIIKSTLTKNLKTKILALMLKNDLKKGFKPFDYNEIGGALLVGCENVIVKAHGSSNSYSFYNAMKLAYKLEKEGISKKIKDVI